MRPEDIGRVALAGVIGGCLVLATAIGGCTGTPAFRVQSPVTVDKEDWQKKYQEEKEWRLRVQGSYNDLLQRPSEVDKLKHELAEMKYLYYKEKELRLRVEEVLRNERMERKNERR